MTVATIDSMSLFIPLSEIKILDKELKVRFENDSLLNYTISPHGDDNEILECQEIDNPRHGSHKTYEHKDSNGNVLYTVHYKYQKFVRFTGSAGAESVTKEGFAISVHSKMLHSNYLQGITELTAIQIYDALMEQSILWFSSDAFCDAEVSDVDLKVDYKVDDFSAYTSLVMRNVHIGYSSVAKRMKTKNKTSGMQIFKRSHRANPYFKLYSKGIELATKSIDFANEYLVGQDLDLARVEVTFCNSSALRKYGLLPNGSNRSLESMLFNVENYGLSAMCKVQREYIAMVMFGTPDSTNPDNIKGCRPADSVMKKVDGILNDACFIRKGIPLSIALTVFAHMVRPNNKRYVSNYVIRRYADYYRDESLLSMQR